MTTTPRFEEALRWKASGNFQEALDLLLGLQEELADSPAFLAVLADVYWELGQLDSAISNFRQGTALAPRAESLSLGLFHCLLEKGDSDGAFDEMRRFLATCESQEYSRLLKEINRSDVGSSR